MYYFIVTDVHSFYDEMLQALNEAGFDKNNPDHTFVSLGDLLDRGNKSSKTLKFVNSLPRKILIRGNHEDLLEKCIARKEFYKHDLHNGTVKTIMNLCGLDESYVFYNDDYHKCFDEISKNKELLFYLDELEDYAELDDYVFVHGWIPSCEESPGEDWRLGDWEKARWFNGMEKWHQGSRIEGKTIFCGHWHTSWGHSKLHDQGSEFGEDAIFEPFVDKGICALDACTAFSHKANCFVIKATDNNTVK